MLYRRAFAYRPPKVVELVGLALLGGVDTAYLIDSYRGEKGKKGTIAG